MNNKLTLHIILVGVAGTIYNDYTENPINQGLTRQKAAICIEVKLPCYPKMNDYQACTLFSGDLGGCYWAHGGGEQEKESPGVQEHYKQPPPGPH
eukprot:1136406-Pelagomonas_calceolata.AAC.1